MSLKGSRCQKSEIVVIVSLNQKVFADLITRALSITAQLRRWHQALFLLSVGDEIPPLQRDRKSVV